MLKKPNFSLRLKNKDEVLLLSDIILTLKIEHDELAGFYKNKKLTILIKLRRQIPLRKCNFR